MCTDFAARVRFPASATATNRRRSNRSNRNGFPFSRPNQQRAPIDRPNAEHPHVVRPHAGHPVKGAALGGDSSIAPAEVRFGGGARWRTSGRDPRPALPVAPAALRRCSRGRARRRRHARQRSGVAGAARDVTGYFAPNHFLSSRSSVPSCFIATTCLLISARRSVSSLRVLMPTTRLSQTSVTRTPFAVLAL